MTTVALISITGPDRVGLISAISGRLFELGANLGDTAFAVLGAGAEFTSVVELPDDLGLEATAAELQALPELADAEVSVTRFALAPVHGPLGRVTHTITVAGGDRPGLIARLSEVFQQFQANIVRLNAERIDDPRGGSHYAVVFAVCLPEDNARNCLATVANTAGSLALSCHWEAA
ncbi:MAG: glycine cleavage system protein R [Rhodospirillales bacterium]